MEFTYFDIAHAIQVHDEIIERSGGIKGLMNVGLLESSLEHVQNDLYYPNLEHRSLTCFFQLTKTIAFKMEIKDLQ